MIYKCVLCVSMEGKFFDFLSVTSITAFTCRDTHLDLLLAVLRVVKRNEVLGLLL